MHSKYIPINLSIISVIFILVFPAWLPVQAGLADVPTSWTNFISSPYTLNGIDMRDGESSADPTQGSASVTPSRSDISSGWDGTNGAVTNCNPQTAGFDRCGLQPSVYVGYYDGGTTWDNVPNSASMNDDFLFFRMRVNGDPRTGGIGLNSTHWNFLIDTDNDGFKEFWIDVDGSDSGGPNSSDIINIYYEDNLSQAITNTDPAPGGTLIDQFTACRNSTGATGCTTSHSQAYPVSDLFPGDTTGEFFIEVQVPITVLDNPAGVQQMFPDTAVKYIFSTSASNSNPLQKDFIPNCTDVDSACEFGDFTPVTLSYFETQATKNGTVFHWATTLETSTVGFDLWAHDGKSWQKVNAEMIPSEHGDSLEPREYMFFAEGIWSDRFQVTDTSAQLKSTWHGPFINDQAYGKIARLDRINWGPIAQATKAQADHQKKSFLVQRKQNKTPAANLIVHEDGIYRITYEALLAEGLDFSGAKARELALLLRDEPIPIYVHQSSNQFGPGSYLEFLGAMNQSIYTKENVYQLRLDSSAAKRIKEEKTNLFRNRPFADHYLATSKVERNEDYSFSSPNDDPWFMEKLLALTDPVTTDLSFEISHMVPRPGAKLLLDYYGVTNYPIAPDHHLRASVNQTFVGEDTFDGLTPRKLAIPLSQGILNDGGNTLRLELPADTGADADLIHLESFSVTYPRAFVAQNGQLRFDSSENQFRMEGFPDESLVAYVIKNDVPTRMYISEINNTKDGYSASMATRANGSKSFWVVSAASRSLPRIEPARPEANITSGSAEYLIISHPLFIDGLAPLVQARTAQGMAVKVVDVMDIYDQFSGGIFDPLAIRDFIRHAAQHQNLRYVLLVGGDSYDYHHYQFPDAVSFIPTIYAETQRMVRFSPVDALLVDLDDDQIPDLPIGRFPVRSTDGLALMIDKTLDYGSKTYHRSAIFAADQDEPNSSFTQLSEKSIQVLPPGWQVQRAYIDDLGLSQARQTLIDGINQGVAFANFFGHSGPTTLSFQRLFSSDDAENELTNHGEPTVFAQWGCWNAYFVYPGYNTLSDKLLLTGPTGAAAVIGAATLTDVASANLLGDNTTRYLMEQDHTLGSALLAGKRDLAKTRPDLKDVILGMMLLGDPALIIEP